MVARPVTVDLCITAGMNHNPSSTANQQQNLASMAPVAQTDHDVLESKSIESQSMD